MLLSKRGQSTLEYAVIIAVVIGALLAMQAMMRRGVEGRLRSSVDDIGDQFSAGISTTSKRVVRTGQEVTRETMGYDLVSPTGTINAAPAYQQGVSGYQVVTPPTIRTEDNVNTATGLAAENVIQ